ncbi:MAG: hypothetical protein GXP38_13905, partial [Chloroflexi bacterium]|nr:hypothetical protein [Chloroflexota bacterium]
MEPQCAFPLFSRLRGIAVALCCLVLLSFSALGFSSAVSADSTPAPTPTPSSPHVQILQELGLSVPALRASGSSTTSDEGYMLKGRIDTMLLQDDRLYAGMGNWFVIFDVSNPAQTRVLGQMWLGESINGIWVNGSYAFLVQARLSAPGRLYVIDLSTTTPRLVRETSVGLHNTIKLVGQGSWLYLLGLGGSIEVWDVSQPLQPQKRGKAQDLFAYFFGDAFIRDTYIYVATSRAVYVIDVADVDAPRRVSEAEYGYGYYWAQATQGDWIYLAGNYSIQVIDISDIVHPQLRQTIQVPGDSTLALFAQGQRLYRLAAQYRTWRWEVYDLQTPQEPVLLSKQVIDDSNLTSQLLMDERGWLYMGLETGLSVLSLAEPNQPRVVGGYRFPSHPSALLRGPATLLFVAESGIFYILDVQNNLFPQVLSWTAGTDQWTDLAFSDDILYVATRKSPGSGGSWRPPIVSAYDVSTPAQPRLLHRWEDMIDPTYGLVAEAERVVGVSADQTHLLILDAKQPQANMILYDGSLVDSELQVLALRNHILFVRGKSAEGKWRLARYDISNPKQPRLLDTTQHPQNWQPLNVLLYRNVGYVLYQDNNSWNSPQTVLILRFNSDGSSQVVDEYRPWFDASSPGRQGFIWNDRLLYSNGSVVALADISQPEHPRYLKQLAIPGGFMVMYGQVVFAGLGNKLITWELPAEGSSMAQDAQQGGMGFAVAAWGERVLVGRGNRLLLYDAHDPSHPRLLGWSPPLKGQVWDITVEDDVAYVALGPAGVQAVDLSDIQHPRLLGSYPLDYFAWSVTVNADRLFSAGAMLDISDPRHIRQLAQVSPGAWDMALAGHILASAKNRLSLNDISDPNDIVEHGSANLVTEAVAASGHLIYAAQGFDGVGLYNADYTGELIPIRRIASDGYALNVARQGQKVYVLPWTGPLQRFTLANLAESPSSRQVLPLPGTSWGLATSTDAAYVTLPGRGLLIVDTSAEEALTEETTLPFTVTK